MLASMSKVKENGENYHERFSFDIVLEKISKLILYLLNIMTVKPANIYILYIRMEKLNISLYVIEFSFLFCVLVLCLQICKSGFFVFLFIFFVVVVILGREQKNLFVCWWKFMVFHSDNK